MQPGYKTYAEFLSEKFPGVGKIQKIGVSLGTTCPNRDGTIGTGGCAYCNNSSFVPDYAGSVGKVDIEGMLEKGKQFFGRKYSSMKYLAYFQGYTNTHGASVEELLAKFREAAKVEDIVGLVIGTRPDCVPDDLLKGLGEIAAKECPVIIEFGAETTYNETLRKINRCCEWETTVDAVMRTNSHGIGVGLHFIMGLPGETEEMMLENVRRAVKLPVETLKFHQLQIIKGTRFAKEYAENPSNFDLFTPERYAALCRRIIEIVGPTGIAIERFVSQSPDNLLIAPKWGLKNYQFVHLLEKP